VQFAQCGRCPAGVLGVRFSSRKLPAALAVDADAPPEQQPAVDDDDRGDADRRNELRR
jgi:hypothetical protein